MKKGEGGEGGDSPRSEYRVSTQSICSLFIGHVFLDGVHFPDFLELMFTVGFNLLCPQVRSDRLYKHTHREINLHFHFIDYFFISIYPAVAQANINMRHYGSHSKHHFYTLFFIL